MLDRSRGKGRVVLTGSATPALLRTAAETLAGRIGLLELTPSRMVEVARTRLSGNRWFWGGYPPVHALAGAVARADWLDGYLTTVLERDLPALGLRLPPARLRRLSTMLTHVHGNLLNVSDLARSLGVSAATVDHDLDVLEGVFFLRRLPPYHANIQKRLTKSPKIYIRDTACCTSSPGSGTRTISRPGTTKGIRSRAWWSRRSSRWPTRIVRPEAFFWRTQAGAEIDLRVVDGERLVPIEIKLGPVDQYAIRGLRQGMADLGLNKGWIVTGSGERRRASPDVEILPVERRGHRCS